MLIQWSLEHAVNRTDVVYENGYCVEKTVDAELLQKHFNGETTLVLPAITENDTCKWLAFDIDNHSSKNESDEEAKKRAIITRHHITEYLREKNIHHVIEDSNGQEGTHIWVFFDKPLPAKLVRAMGITIAQSTSNPVEVFPKQASRYDTPKQIGNGIRWWGKHHSKNHWSILRASNDVKKFTMYKGCNIDAFLKTIPFNNAEFLLTKITQEKIDQVLNAKNKPQAGNYCPISVNVDDTNKVARAIGYAKKTPPAIEGDGGEKRTMCLISKLVHGFALTADEVWHVIENSGWNGSCNPPWNKNGIDRKVEWVEQQEKNGKYDTAKGYMLVDNIIETINNENPDVSVDTKTEEKKEFRFCPVDVDELEDEQTLIPIWDNIINKGDTVQLVGPPKKGKSTFLASLLKAIILGENFGKQCFKTKVLLIIEEDERRLKRRLKALGMLEISKGWIKVVSKLRMGGEDGYNKTEWKTLVKNVKEYCIAEDVGMVIFDTFSKFSPMADENSNAEVQAAINCLDCLKINQVACMLIHHPSRAGYKEEGESDVNHGRGGSTFESATDSNIICKREGSMMRLRVQGRDILEDNKFYFEFTPIPEYKTGAYAYIETSLIQDNSTLGLLKKALVGSVWKTIKQLKIETGKDCENTLKQLYDTGKVERRTNPKNPKEFEYRFYTIPEAINKNFNVEHNQ